MTTEIKLNEAAKASCAPAAGSASLAWKLKSLYYRIFKRYRRLELKFCTYAEADALLRKQGIPGNPPEGWRIADEEDNNRAFGMVWMERRERIDMQSGQKLSHAAGDIRQPETRSDNCQA